MGWTMAKWFLFLFFLVPFRRWCQSCVQDFVELITLLDRRIAGGWVISGLHFYIERQLTLNKSLL